MAEASPQRSYRAPCPGCGAQVEFRSAQSVFAICSYCRSAVVREGRTLTRVGRVAELFEDHSPLQLQATGSWQGKPFSLVGRLQYRGERGGWTEWIALFEDGAHAVLGEDNGAYVLQRPAQVGRELPQPQHLRVGNTTAIDGKPFEVASNQQVALVSAQGELPKRPHLGQPFPMVELRSADGEVLNIDYGADPPRLARGRSVRLEELRMAGLREASAKDERARRFDCPRCGAPVAVALAASRSVTCRSCHSVIDMGAGLGGELRHAQQEEALTPLIPLGSIGQLQGAQWQVVGYRHRIGHEPGQDDESFGWDEYLLYNRQRGFMFLVDSERGFSVVKPTTGAPSLSPGEQSASYLGTRYELKFSYEAQTTYVAGEFYWPVERGQRSFNRDFAEGASLLSMERTPREVTWSGGSAIAGDVVAKAFRLEDRRRLLARGDAGPTGNRSEGVGLGKLLVMFAAIVIVLVLIQSCIDGAGSQARRGNLPDFAGSRLLAELSPGQREVSLRFPRQQRRQLADRFAVQR